MVFRSYQWNILLRVGLLFADMLFFAFALQQEKWYVSTSVSGLLMPVMIYNLVHYVSLYRQEVRDFLLTIRQKDYQRYYKESLDHQTVHPDMNYAFHTIVKELQNVRIEKEAHYHHLREVVEHLEAGIISYKEGGAIHLLNQSARSMLQIPTIRCFEELKAYYPWLHDKLIGLKPGEREIIHLQVRERSLSLALRTNVFRLQSQQFTLISLQDIRSELEAREVEAWQSLIRLLRHEIMNSATPISSLTEAAKDSMEELLHQKDQLPEVLCQELEDLHLSLTTIHNRTRGLLKFVQTYRKLTGLPDPDLEPVNLSGLTNHVLRLLQGELERHGITLEKRLSDDHPTIQADPDQIEQVVINILLNAIDAVKSRQDPTIRVHLKKTANGRYCLRVTDNGEGIPADSLQKIFMPFYTTKKEGSGIGLSLARQIMKRHHGEITVYSTKNKGTACALFFL